MNRARLGLLALLVVSMALAHPRPSAALVCEVLCWTQGADTCWQTSACKQVCCVTGPRCISPCFA